MHHITPKSFKRILVFGGTDAAYYFIVNARRKGFEVVVFSDPFRLSGKISESQTFREALVKENIEYIETTKIERDLVLPYVDDFTIGFSIVTFWIFSPDVINLFNGSFYNYHGALLPDEKGGGTFTWKILSQSFNGGLTIHKIDSGLDTGPIVLERKFTYPDSCRKPVDFENYKGKFEKNLLDEFLLKILEPYLLVEHPQQPGNSSYWPLLNTNINGVVDWKWNCEEIRIFINAFDDPYEGASTKYTDKRVYIKDCSCLKTELQYHPFQSGIIIRKDKEGIYVAALGGILKIGIIRSEKHEDITQNLKLGERLYSPTEMLGNSLGVKARYDFWGIRNKILQHPEKNSVYMREIDDSCVDQLHEIFVDQEFCEILHVNPHKRISETDKYISNQQRIKASSDISNVNMEWMIQTSRSNKAIGLCRLVCDFITNKADLHIAVISSYCSDNVVYECYEVIIRYCFFDLNIHKLSCNVLCDRKPIVEIFRNLGFGGEDNLTEVAVDNGGVNGSSVEMTFVRDK